MLSAKARSSAMLAVTLAVCGCAADGPVGESAPARSAQGGAETPNTATAGDPRCAALSRIALADTHIVSAGLHPENELIPTVASALPPFCRVVGTIHPEAGSEIRFEVWLPSASWNGRFTGVGNGGFAGSIRYKDMAAAIRVGQATASTDTGHTEDASNPSSWARGNPVGVRDYGWRAVHLTAVNAKAIIAAYHGRAPDRSYFASCSNGGRQGLMEAARFPEDYDGILAGDPAAQFTRAVMSLIWTQQAQQPAGAAFRPEQMQRLQDEVLKQCDALDGQLDGLVDDPRICHVDLAALGSRGTADLPHTFTDPQVQALRRIYAGPPTAGGRTVAFKYPPSGAEAGRPVPMLGWDGWIASGGTAPPTAAVFIGGLLQNLMTPPFAADHEFDWKRDPRKLTAALGRDLDAPSDLSKFFARGGKLIVYQGWADAAVPPEQTIDFYESILARSGRVATESARLFMVPGMQHCLGGTGADMFGQTSAPAQSASPDDNIAMALQQWVENGRVPESVVGVRSRMPPRPGSSAQRQRLLCAYPARAVLTLGADADKAASYSCRRPDALATRRP